MSASSLRLHLAAFIFVILPMYIEYNLALPSQLQASRHNHAGHNKTKSNHRKSGSFLWQIDTVPPSYFFGTIHVPYTRVWDAIPPYAKRAFFSAQNVYFELNLNDHTTLSSISACQLLPNGMHLSQVLPSDLFVRIKLHLDYVKKSMADWITQDQLDRGISSDYLFSTVTSNWERKLPVWVMLMIASLSRSDIASRGMPVLDLYLARLAMEHQKKVGAIERVEEQCQPLNQINSTLVLFALNETLKKQEDLRLGVSKAQFTVDNLIDQYRNGNLDSVFSTDTMLFPTFNMKSTNLKSSNEEDLKTEHSEEDFRMAKEFERVFQEYFLYRRNDQMASRVKSLIDSNPDTSFFFAFGAGHFIGKNSVLEKMEAAGYKIKHILTDELSHNFQHKAPTDSISSIDSNKNTVQGTFEDLSEEEKTRALLQFLQYHQQHEQENETRRFKEMIKGPLDESETSTKKPTPSEIQDEKAIEESLKIWYGVSCCDRISFSVLRIVFCALFSMKYYESFLMKIF